MRGKDVKQILAMKYIVRRIAALLIVAAVIAVPAALGAYSFELYSAGKHSATGSGSDDSLSYEQVKPHILAYIEESRRLASGSSITDDAGTAGENAAPLPDVAVGTVLIYAGDQAPGGFFLCDGAEVSRGKYRALYEVIGNKYGEGDGVTTFNLPDMRALTVASAGQTVRFDEPAWSDAWTPDAGLAFKKVSEDTGPPPVVDTEKDQDDDGDNSEPGIPGTPDNGVASMYFIIKY
jgi:hypothetical protein